MSIHEFDVVVIGAGPTGENIADYAHRGGLSTAVVESDLVGGECSYWACIPSKAVLRPVRAVRAAREIAGAREGAAERADPVASLARRDAFVSGYDDSAQVQWLDGTGVTLVRGHARLGGERRVVVDTGDDRLELHARAAVVVCTGTEAFVPPIEGLAQAGPWTSREASGMREVPARLAIIGGGVVACEMATAAAGLGAQQVTLLVRGQRLLEQLEPFASARVQEGLSAQGVDVRFSTSARRVERHASTVALDLDDGSTLEAHEVLVATGRRPRTGDLGLETVGLTPGQALTTDATLAVTGADGGGGSGVPWLFAAGDVNGRAPLTHHGKYQARLLGDHLASRGRAPASSSTSSPSAPAEPIPWGPFTATADTEAFVQVIFTDPQVGTVGLTGARARERGIAATSVECDLGEVAGASLHADGYAGRAAMVVDPDRGVLVGATLVGPDVGELLHAATIAITGEVPLDRLWHAVPAFPTMSEVWLRLLEQCRR